jgi:amidase
MNPFPELRKYDGLGLAELVRTKQISPAELVEYTIARIEAYNPKITGSNR